MYVGERVRAEAERVEQAAERPDIGGGPDALAGVQVAQLGRAVHRRGVRLYPFFQFEAAAPVQRCWDYAARLSIWALEGRP